MVGMVAFCASTFLHFYNFYHQVKQIYVPWPGVIVCLWTILKNYLVSIFFFFCILKSEMANYYTDNSHSWAEQGKTHEMNLIPHRLPPQVAQQFLH